MSRALKTKLLPQQTQVALSLQPILRAFSPPACHPHLSSVCTTAWGPPCSTHGLGLEPKMGIYEATSALPDRTTSIGQDCVVLATCSGAPAPRRSGGGTNTEQGISVLSFLKQSCEMKQLLCPQATVFMLKGNKKSVQLL